MLIIDQTFFNSLYHHFETKNYELLCQGINQLAQFYKSTESLIFPKNYDLLFLVYQILNINISSKISLLSIKLMACLPLNISFSLIYVESPYKNMVISQLLHLLGNQTYGEHVLKCFLNISGGLINDRDYMLHFLSFAQLFEMIQNSKVSEFRSLVCRIILNYCRHKLSNEVGAQVMINVVANWDILDSASKKHLVDAVIHIETYLQIYWVQTIKMHGMMPVFFTGLVLDNPDLTYSILHLIIRYMNNGETVNFNCDYFDCLLDSGNEENVRACCVAIEHIIKFDTTKMIANQFISWGLFAKLIHFFENASFVIKVDACYALCNFVDNHLNNYYDVIMNFNIIPDFLDFLTADLIENDLKLIIVQTLYSIFEKITSDAIDQSLIQKFKAIFISNGGSDLFEEYQFDDCESIASVSSLFLADFIDENIPEK